MSAFNAVVQIEILASLGNSRRRYVSKARLVKMFADHLLDPSDAPARIDAATKQCREIRQVIKGGAVVYMLAN